MSQSLSKPSLIARFAGLRFGFLPEKLRPTAAASAHESSFMVSKDGFQKYLKWRKVSQLLGDGEGSFKAAPLLPAPRSGRLRIVPHSLKRFFNVAIGLGQRGQKRKHAK